MIANQGWWLFANGALKASSDDFTKGIVSMHPVALPSVLVKLDEAARGASIRGDMRRAMEFERRMHIVLDLLDEDGGLTHE